MITALALAVKRLHNNHPRTEIFHRCKEVAVSKRLQKEELHEINVTIVGKLLDPAVV